MSPKYKFYEVSVCIKSEEENDKGKVKTKKSVYKYLIDAADTNMAEKKTFKLMEGTLDEWEIIGINLSRISEIVINEQY